MPLITIEDEVYRVTKKQMKEIEEIKRNEDEMLIADFLEQNRHLYKLIGIISFSFRE
jgi:hypothetical protein